MHCSGHLVLWAPDSVLAGSFLHSSKADIWKKAYLPKLHFFFFFCLSALTLSSLSFHLVFPPNSSHFLMPSSFYYPLTLRTHLIHAFNLYFNKKWGRKSLLIYIVWDNSCPHSISCVLNVLFPYLTPVLTARVSSFIDGDPSLYVYLAYKISCL